MKNSNSIKSVRWVLFLSMIMIFPFKIWAQKNEMQNFNRDSLIAAAKEIMLKTRYCALITLDKSGHPQARTMDAFAPDDDLVVWLFSAFSRVRNIQCAVLSD